MELTGPEGRILARLDPHEPSLSVERDGTTLVSSRLPVGRLCWELHRVDWTDAAVHVDDPHTVEESYELPAGKARQRHHRARATTVTYGHGAGDLQVDLRVAADGVAVRYRVTGEGRALSTGDGTAFEIPRGAVAWLTPFEKAHEASARQQPVGEADGDYCLPGLFAVDGQWCLLAEAGADGTFGASRLAVADGTATFAPPETQLNARYPLVTPWRVAVVGDLATVVESTLVTDLVDPDGGPGDSTDAPDDDEWVDPGRVAWSWWSESGSTDDLARQREYVDYAADRGWEYVLVDDGWERSREGMPAFVDYAADRDVGVFLWAHWTDLDTGAKRDRRLSTWRDWGVAGVKVDFMDHDDQGRLAFYDRLAAAAADHELLVNFHGSVVPSGLSRRYPHVLTYEGVMGAEYYKWSTLSAEHNCTLPYTRNAVGSMDYTPVTFSADTRHTSVGHELALSVVFESGLQHFADSPGSYAARPLAESFLERVPAAWERTRLVGGHPGVEATVARQAPSGTDSLEGIVDGEWFLGSITAGPERTVGANCSFLGEGEWRARVVRDDGADGLDADATTVTAGETLDVDVAANGGFVARFERA